MSIERIKCACGASTDRTEIDAAYRYGQGGWCWSIHTGWECPRCVAKKRVLANPDRLVRDPPRSMVQEQCERAWRVKGGLG